MTNINNAYLEVIDKQKREKLKPGTTWVSVSSWGDVDDICEADDSTKVQYIIETVNTRVVFYKMKYNGNPTPDKISKDSIKNFIDECKPLNRY